ncbi:hypothetical protein MVEN_00803100 [Mycena venus]|uniref:Uncharacterized protein n=1 Tax=Mycena venus TaxID=2733690 RepID=A0A8H6YLB6_9AGAR|nr:hypothetical protein MVEN_00803100 [Mycena venus]
MQKWATDTQRTSESRAPRLLSKRRSQHSGKIRSLVMRGIYNVLPCSHTTYNSHPPRMAVLFTLFFVSIVWTSHGKRHVGRQDDSDGPMFGCGTFCTPIQSIDPTVFTAQSCTNCLIDQMAACFDCDDSAGDAQDAQDSQDIISTFVSGCNAAGFHVQKVNVTGAFAASGDNVTLIGQPFSAVPTSALQTNPYSCAPTPAATADWRLFYGSRSIRPLISNSFADRTVEILASVLWASHRKCIRLFRFNERRS